MTPHVVVIGAGIVGASIAYRLATGGARVTVLEAAGPAAQASGKSFGWINASFFADENHFRLRKAAVAAYHRLEADLGVSLVDWSGCLWWEEQGVGFDAQRDTLTRLGYACQELDRAAFAALAPRLAATHDRSLLLPDEGAIDLVPAAEALLDRAAEFGARLWAGCRALGVRTKSGQVTGVETADGAIAADHVVVAAGIGSPTLLRDLGVAIEMPPRPGLMMRTNAVDRVLHHIMVSPGMEFRQDAAGRILAPTVASHQGDDSEALDALPGTMADRALDRLRALLPGIDLTWQRVTLANRPVPPDGLPVVGAGPVAGLYIATMHSGATLGALIGELAAAEILRGEEAPLLRPYRPDRFA